MIWTEIYIKFVEGLKNFFDLFPDVDIDIPDSVSDNIVDVLSFVNYFFPLDLLKPILVIEFTLINVSIFISAYKGGKDFIK